MSEHTKYKRNKFVVRTKPPLSTQTLKLWRTRLLFTISAYSVSSRQCNVNFEWPRIQCRQKGGRLCEQNASLPVRRKLNIQHVRFMFEGGLHDFHCSHISQHRLPNEKNISIRISSFFFFFWHLIIGSENSVSSTISVYNNTSTYITFSSTHSVTMGSIARHFYAK